MIRNYSLIGSNSSTFHVFCDASTTAIAAAIYEVTTWEGVTSSHLVMAKNKTVPRKKRFDINGLEKTEMETTKINRLVLIQHCWLLK
jgi:hypothetical protein